MRAIVQSGYGSPERVLTVTDLPRPRPGRSDVLIRVAAASVHPDVWHAVAGRPAVLRLMGAGVLRPTQPTPGIDLSGTIDSVGSDVTHLTPGDEVFGETVRGMQWQNGGTFAEYAVADAHMVAHKPRTLTHVESAGIPTPALIARENLAEAGGVRAGSRVLVNGAGGGVGIFAVQLAKIAGATVTAVDAAPKLDMLTALGADHVVDYLTEDFVAGGERYDLVIDVPGNRSPEEIRRILQPDGRYSFIGHDDFGRAGGRLLGQSIPRFLNLALRPIGRRASIRKTERDTTVALAEIAALADAGSLRVPIDRTFPLEKAPDAVRHLMSGSAVGRIIITI